MTVSFVDCLAVSGGKDSTAMYLLALEQDVDFCRCSPDVGNEHQCTLDYVRDLASKTGGPEVKIVRADFQAAIERKRKRYRSRMSRKK